MFEKPVTSLASGPRPISLLLKLRIYFGGAIKQLGCLFLGLGLFGVSLSNLPQAWWSVIQFIIPLEEADGEVLAVEYTNIEEDNLPLLSFRYQFRTVEGEEYSGQSFSTNNIYQPGDNAIVEYRKSNPDISRIKGMRVNKTTLWLSFILIFPFIGAGLLFAAFRKSRQEIYLLQNGELAQGRLIDKTPTNTRINNRRVYRLTFEFKTLYGDTCQAVTKTHLTEKLEDEAEERILYDPRDPATAVVLDDLPTAVALDHWGNFIFSSGWEKIKTPFTLIIPALSILVNTIDWYEFIFLLPAQ